MHDFSFWTEISGVTLFIVGDASDGEADWFGVYFNESFADAQEEDLGPLLSTTVTNKIEDEIRKHLEIHHTENPDLP